jgi:hypothetical protein
MGYYLFTPHCQSSSTHIIKSVKSLVYVNTQKLLLRINININALIDERGLR